MFWNRISALLAAPGVIIHELAHYLFCQLAGAPIHKAVFFRLGNPAGYVVHGSPRRFRGHFAIVVGPLLINSGLAFILFLILVAMWGGFGATGNPPSGLSLWLSPLLLWCGLSISLHALPSRADAASLWQMTRHQLHLGNLSAILGYPVAGAIYLANLLKFLRIDWVYAGILLWLAIAAAFRVRPF
ncbi:MAG: metalloprotease family protein [Chloroflexi bacterium]|nr:metalloprotease family protein [Chloroflexota bacterium]MCL5076460.1 metalloprotease family protein [Chloroflexota bacterium]